MSEPVSGRLAEPSTAPRVGELVQTLVAIGSVRIGHILSGELDAPVDYDELDDEWFVVLNGEATLVVGGAAHELRPGDWMLIPRHTPHRLVRTNAGTCWLTVRVG